MPDSYQVSQGFALEKNTNINSYSLSEINVGHDEVKRWNEYSYPITMFWIWTGPEPATKNDMDRFFVSFSNYVEGVKVIRADSGRPYKCVFQWPLGSTPIAYFSDEPESKYTQIKLVYNGFGKRIGEAEAGKIIRREQGWN